MNTSATKMHQPANCTKKKKKPLIYKIKKGERSLTKVFMFLGMLTFIFQLNYYSFSFSWHTGVLTLDGSLKKRLAGFAGGHTIVVAGGHVSTYEAKPLRKGAQGVFAAAPAAACGALVRTVGSVLFEVAAQCRAVHRWGVACRSLSPYASSTALRGVGRDASRTRPPTAPSALWTAWLGLNVQLWAALSGRHDTCVEDERKGQEELVRLKYVLKVQICRQDSYRCREITEKACIQAN